MDGVPLKRRSRSARSWCTLRWGNLLLLRITGIDAAPDLYGKLEGEAVPRMMAMIATNDGLEKSIKDKAGVTALLRRSLDAVRAAFTQAPDAELDRLELFFGERTTVRRVLPCEPNPAGLHSPGWTKAGSGRHWVAHVPPHVSLLARFGWYFDGGAAEADAARSDCNHHERLRRLYDGIEAGSQQQTGTDGTSAAAQSGKMKMATEAAVIAPFCACEEK